VNHRKAHGVIHVTHISLPVSEEITSAATRNAVPEINPEALFGENYARLQELKKKYDPDLVFFKWNPITPAA
jgi:hypothetical protein